MCRVQYKPGVVSHVSGSEEEKNRDSAGVASCRLSWAPVLGTTRSALSWLHLLEHHKISLPSSHSPRRGTPSRHDLLLAQVLRRCRVGRSAKLLACAAAWGLPSTLRGDADDLDMIIR